MHIGVLLAADSAELKLARQIGFRSMEWVRFEQSPAAEAADWKPWCAQFAAEANALGLRISAIGAHYRNPLDPRQTEFAGRIFRRAIEVASHLGVRTVSGFAGAVIEPAINERGGNPVYDSTDQHIPQLLAFWDPIAEFAQDHGVRLAFEHCPQGPFHLPVMHYNLLGRPSLWEKFFNATRRENIGLEWDPSHLICQFIDPVANLKKFGARVFHVHAKDAYVDERLLREHGICHAGVAEHRFPGFGQADWGQIIHTLVRAGYDSDLNIEGWHDPVFRNHAAESNPPSSSPLAGRQLEAEGLRVAKKYLEQFVPGD
jgi:sugar phosphate isomerase/epimerase